jgi:hypothetical protein
MRGVGHDLMHQSPLLTDIHVLMLQFPVDDNRVDFHLHVAIHKIGTSFELCTSE